MAKSSQNEFSDFEDDGILPIMDMLNFKIAKLEEREIGFRDEDKLYITQDQKYYAEEYCRLNKQVKHWKSLCESTEYKVAKLEKKVEWLEKENDELKKKAVNLKEVESIMEEQQNVLEALELKLRKTEKDFGEKLAEEKRVVELKENIITVLERKLRELKEESQNTEQQLKDLKDFINKCNDSLEANINSLVNEFHLSNNDHEISDEALGINDGPNNELVHLKLKKNLCKLSEVVQKAFTEILSMGNENNASLSRKDQGKENACHINTSPCDNDDQYLPVCSPVTPEQCTLSD